MANVMLENALAGLEEARAAMPKLVERTKNHVPCFLISDGLIRHWRSKAFPHLDLSRTFFARADVMVRPEEEERLFTTEWPQFQRWMAYIQDLVEGVAVPMEKAVMPGVAENQNGPAAAASLRRAWRSVEAAVRYQKEHWGTEDARFNQAPELNFTEFYFSVEGCARWIDESAARVETARQLLAMSEATTHSAVRSAKLKTPKGGREGQVMAIVKDNPSLNQAEVAAKMALHRSALSREPLKTAYLRARALHGYGEHPDGYVDEAGNVEAIADEE